MIIPEKPDNERLRLRAVRQLGLLEELPQETYDNITLLAQEICETPVALLTILDDEKQWFKSRKGFDLTETDRDISFCGHAILEPGKLFEVEDALNDPRFDKNPLVTFKDINVRSYAGIPILNKQGQALGTLCVLSKKPKKLNLHQRKCLIALGKQVEILYEFHYKSVELEDMRDELQENNKVLQDFAGNVSHDLKMPLANIILSADIVRAKYSSALDKAGLGYLEYIKNSGLKLSEYVTSLLEYYSGNGEKVKEIEKFFLNDLIEDILDLLEIDANCMINMPEENMAINGNRAAIGQVLMNLISNSIKHNPKEEILIDITCEEQAGYYYFGVRDNGVGIPEKDLNKIFDLFTVIKVKNAKSSEGHGIGLSTVKKLITIMNGDINVKSDKEKGTLFEFSVEKA
ncbi:GAF domain-containing sensor histidine kinase [Gramella sp. GC03-9]|uniref:histidine kinase n=1 Tax=Christiangramia oceanisediminis TaxID=2920386 RepID=A0A9X2KZ48_9FLAO|nr:GAF domain-containing sensor histidine kinase [Gramella oceanisediminis]MCP9200821.1 GAF domain-containing sensor histidine kinase [Gramella oceanisediminis]